MAYLIKGEKQSIKRQEGFVVTGPGMPRITGIAVCFFFLE
jgi:hypothetical protein